MEQGMTMQERVIEMMGEEIETLGSNLMEAKMDYADITLNDGDYKCQYERRMTCKVIEGQLSILEKMMSKITSMSIDIKMPSLAKI